MKEIKESIESIDWDIKVEVCLADLLEDNKIDKNSILISPQSVFKRTFNKDILGVKYKYDTFISEITQLYVNISREGIYDALPEGLFHAPIEKKSFDDTDGMRKEVEIHRKEEQAARKFFLPIENEIYRHRIDLELEERKALIGFSDNVTQNLFLKFWDLEAFYHTADRILDERQVSILLYILPVVHQIAGNLPLTALCFKTIMKQEFDLSIAPPKAKQVNEKEVPALSKRLGNLTLGVNFICGSQFNDGVPHIQVSIGPMPRKNVKDYLIGGKAYQTLLILYHFFLPLEATVETKVLIRDPDKPFRLYSQEKKEESKEHEEEKESRLAYCII
ncbi:MAG: type VI secretion system baseplate subunit TssG [Chitinophagales bacterium]